MSPLPVMALLLDVHLEGSFIEDYCLIVRVVKDEGRCVGIYIQYI